MACHFWLTFEENWFQGVIWSDNKCFVLHQALNKQNDRYCAPAQPHNVNEFKKGYRKKEMAWVEMVDGLFSLMRGSKLPLTLIST